MNLDPRLPPTARAAITTFLRAHSTDDGAAGLVVGLSGGIDSAVVARLAVDAVGPAHVLGALLPDAAHPDAVSAETKAFAEAIGIAWKEVPIDPIERSVRDLLPEIGDRATWGNVKARSRMVVLYALARERNLRVAGTGNKSEILVGYFTKFGDGGVDLLPIGDLYKTQVRALAVELGIPASIRDRVPTAGLWEGQTDEGELGIPYVDLDRILFGLEQLVPPAEIARATGLPLETVRAIASRVLANRHKRRSPPIPKLGLRTVGLDWRD